MALVDVVRTVVQASVQVPSAQGEPVRAAVDVKVGGASCNVLPNLDPWLTLALGAVKALQNRKSQKSTVLKEARGSETGETVGASRANGSATGEPAKTGGPKKKPAKLLWDVAVSAPDAVLVLYGPFNTEVLKVRHHNL